MKEIVLSLTGKNSHTLKIPLGQGSLSIGEIGMNKKNFDLLVDAQKPILWDAFNTFYTGAGKERKNEYPYGDWPRFFYYYGSDTGFAQWTEKRETEDFYWVPQKSLAVDFSHSNIHRLSIHSLGHELNIKMGPGIDYSYQSLHLSGDLNSIHILECRRLHSFSLNVPKNSSNIPDFPAIQEVVSLNVNANVVGKAFDLKNLLAFKDIQFLSLSGHMLGLEHLSEFKNLESIAFRNMPNLKNVPPLKTWDKLKSIIAINIDEVRGKSLRKELNQLKKEREMDYSTVSKLRKPIWFTTEYGIPFSNWQNHEKKATKKYKDSIKLLKKAKTENEIKEIIIDFTSFFNELSSIETMEREDIGEAVLQLIQIPSIEVDREKAIQWFDLARDY